MNDSARMIRMVYRINPYNGLYDAIVNNAHFGMQPEYVKPQILHPIVQAQGRAERTQTEPKEEVSPQECVVCFCSANEGTFINGQYTRLYFCKKCGGGEHPYDWKRPMLVLMLTHLFWFALLLFR